MDLESVTALNNGLIAFPEVLLLASRDHELVSTVANPIVMVTHNQELARYTGRMFEMRDGRIGQISIPSSFFAQNGPPG